MVFKGPSQPKPFYESMILELFPSPPAELSRPLDFSPQGRTLHTVTRNNQTQTGCSCRHLPAQKLRCQFRCHNTHFLWGGQQHLILRTSLSQVRRALLQTKALGYLVSLVVWSCSHSRVGFSNPLYETGSNSCIFFSLAF